jgi:hypothetical protein
MVMIGQGQPDRLAMKLTLFHHDATLTVVVACLLHVMTGSPVPGYVSRQLYKEGPQAGWGLRPYYAKNLVAIARGAGLGGGNAICISLSKVGRASCRTNAIIILQPTSGSTTTPSKLGALAAGCCCNSVS